MILSLLSFVVLLFVVTLFVLLAFYHLLRLSFIAVSIEMFYLTMHLFFIGPFLIVLIRVN